MEKARSILAISFPFLPKTIIQLTDNLEEESSLKKDTASFALSISKSAVLWVKGR